jgi:hypothetical protein
MRAKRRTLITIGMITAAGVLAVLLVLIAAGVLVLPSTSPPSPVTINSVQFNIVQGTNASGNPWFGHSPVIYSGTYNGTPFSVSPKATFNETLSLDNYDSAPHTIYSVSAFDPFTFVSSHPVLPAEVPADEDSAPLTMTFQAPSASGTYVLIVNINTLPPPS